MDGLRLLVIAIVVLITQCSGECQASQTVELEQRFWLADIAAQGIKSPAWTGNIDLKKDLGFRNTDLASIRLLWHINDNNSWYFDYFNGQFGGKYGTQTAARNFRGLAFKGGYIRRKGKLTTGILEIWLAQSIGRNILMIKLKWVYCLMQKQFPYMVQRGFGRRYRVPLLLPRAMQFGK